MQTPQMAASEEVSFAIFKHDNITLADRKSTTVERHPSAFAGCPKVGDVSAPVEKSFRKHDAEGEKHQGRTFDRAILPSIRPNGARAG